VTGILAAGGAEITTGATGDAWLTIGVGGGGSAHPAKAPALAAASTIEIKRLRATTSPFREFSGCRMFIKAPASRPRFEMPSFVGPTAWTLHIPLGRHARQRPTR
jgi:hypothetical protein